jgi:hypothetical protein
MVARYRGAMVMTGRMATMGMAAEWALASLGLLIRRVGMAREWLRPPPAGHGYEGLRGRYQTHSHYRRWPPGYPLMPPPQHGGGTGNSRSISPWKKNR